MHQQQNVETGPVQPVHFIQPYQTTSAINSYRHSQSTVIGTLLLIVGSLSVIFSLVEIVSGADDYSRSLGIASGVGGIVYSVLIIITGGFGIGAGSQKSRCKITTFLVLAVVGAIFAGAQVFRASLIAWAYSTAANVVFVNLVHGQTLFAMSVMLALLGAFGFALCLWGSILCCATGGCCGSQPVVYAMMPAGESAVVAAMAQVPADQQPPVYPTPSQYPGYDSK